MTAPCALTVLHSPYLRLAKRLRQDGGSDGYDKAKTLNAHAVPLDGLDSIHALLLRLLPQWACCVIRGELIDPARRKGIRRLLHVCKETGELPTFQDVPRRWIAIDLDGVPLPNSIPATNLPACAAYAIDRLPVPFSNAAAIVQASASHGVKPGLRLRVWAWLSRPTWGHELKRWLRDYPCDLSVFGAVQPIYTARPALADGVADPMPERLVYLSGTPAVAVPPPEELAPPPCPELAEERRNALAGTSDRYIRRCLETGAARIINAGEGRRHPTIVGETCRLARFVNADLIGADVVAKIMRAAAKEAGLDDEGRGDEVDAAIAYGLANPWTGGPVPKDGRDG